MLILTRYLDESFYIGNDIKVTLLSAKGGQARIGVEAPKDVPIYREELYEKMSSEELKTSFSPRGE
jgi:carbon storage regulator